MVRKRKPWPKSLAQQKNDFTSEGAPAPHADRRSDEQRRIDAPAPNAEPPPGLPSAAGPPER